MGLGFNSVSNQGSGFLTAGVVEIVERPAVGFYAPPKDRKFTNSVPDFSSLTAITVKTKKNLAKDSVPCWREETRTCLEARSNFWRNIVYWKLLVIKVKVLKRVRWALLLTWTCATSPAIWALPRQPMMAFKPVHLSMPFHHHQSETIACGRVIPDLSSQ